MDKYNTIKYVYETLVPRRNLEKFVLIKQPKKKNFNLNWIETNLWTICWILYFPMDTVLFTKQCDDNFNGDNNTKQVSTISYCNRPTPPYQS